MASNDISEIRRLLDELETNDDEYIMQLVVEWREILNQLEKNRMATYKGGTILCLTTKR